MLCFFFGACFLGFFVCYFLFLYIGGFLPCLIVFVLRLVFSKSIFADTRLRKISFLQEAAI